MIRIREKNLATNGCSVRAQFELDASGTISRPADLFWVPPGDHQTHDPDAGANSRYEVDDPDPNPTGSGTKTRPGTRACGDHYGRQRGEMQVQVQMTMQVQVQVPVQMEMQVQVQALPEDMVVSDHNRYRQDQHRQRLQQPVQLGLGRAFTSSKKARPKKKGTTTALVDQGDATPSFEPVLGTLDEGSDQPALTTSKENVGPLDAKKQKQRTQDATQAAYDQWSSLIPCLVDLLLRYQGATYRATIPDVPTGLSCCATPATCTFSHTVVKCLLQSVEHGLFPTAPHQPRMAFGIEVLAFFKALFERSLEATQALAHALNTYYARRGFYLYNIDDKNIIEPFRKGLGYAMQWYDMLLVEVEHQKEQALLRALANIKSRSVQDNPGAVNSSPEYPSATTDPLSPVSPTTTTDPSPPIPPTAAKAPTSISGNLSPGECARFLQQLCPLCFGGDTYGCPVGDGADIHVNIDGNFNHRHAHAAGDCPEFHHPRHIVPKEDVDQCGERIEKARAAGKRKKSTSKTRVPDAAIDACEEAHEAGSGSKIKTNLDKFDDRGVMGMICRHDIPLFLANIDTPGEQQKFGVALIEHLFQYIPQHATVVAAYDVGCVTDRSRQLYEIFTKGVSERLGFVTTAMHAYAHQWACQVVYAPRMRKGMGLTDGEAIGNDSMPGMAAALHRKLKNARKRLDSVGKRSNEAKFNDDFVREQWDHQQSAQMSLQSQAPIRVKKELDSVLSLQAEIDSTQKTLESTRKALGTADNAGCAAKSILDQLDKQQQDLAKRAEELYSSVNVAEAFPGLEGLQLKFVRGLLMARDMKINIRKRAIGNFFEWDRLKQVSGGRDEPLGTKLHQKARANIQKRAPALTNAIKRFNKKIDQLNDLYQPDWMIPLPEKLPTDLGKLKDNPNLLTDVWISTSTGADVPPWLSDPQVRDAIAEMHTRDRCAEERLRVGVERDNMCRWFRKEFLAVEVALHSESNNPLVFALMRHKSFLHVLTSRWRGEAIAGHALKLWEEDAAAKACHLMGVKQDLKVYRFLEPLMAEPTLISCEDNGDPDDLDSDGCNDGLNANDVLMDDILWDREDFAEEESFSVYLGIDESYTEDESTPSVVLGHAAQSDDAPEHYNLDNDIKVSDLWKPQLSSLDQALENFPIPLACLNDEPMDGVTTDKTLLFRLAFNYTGDSVPSDDHSRVLVLDHTKYTWDPQDISRLRLPTQRLNSACINSGAALIQDILSASPSTSKSSACCCVFSTFDLLMVRDGTNSDTMWRRTSPLKYWTKSIWILPIHRVYPYEHWVLAVVQLRTGRVFLFDSLAEASHWLYDMKDISTLIARLSIIASHYGKEFIQPIPLDIPWDFRSVSTGPVQTTSYSCGFLSNLVLQSLVFLHLQSPTSYSVQDLIFEPADCCEEGIKPGAELVDIFFALFLVMAPNIIIADPIEVFPRCSIENQLHLISSGTSTGKTGGLQVYTLTEAPASSFLRALSGHRAAHLRSGRWVVGQAVPSWLSIQEATKDSNTFSQIDRLSRKYLCESDFLSSVPRSCSLTSSGSYPLPFLSANCSTTAKEYLTATQLAVGTSPPPLPLAPPSSQAPPPSQAPSSRPLLGDLDSEDNDDLEDGEKYVWLYQSSTMLAVLHERTKSFIQAVSDCCRFFWDKAIVPKSP
ncbi:hypothetical protein BKA70DRAFT_1534649 [Coprinopsis sp. MPI-PUGE-AT-0042]|nr:hypothetical protein BKA70DRAFT_1534649 [Coprinopsis sp. MPI-PUGE-AT-0042]